MQEGANMKITFVVTKRLSDGHMFLFFTVHDLIPGFQNLLEYFSSSGFIKILLRIK